MKNIFTLLLAVMALNSFAQSIPESIIRGYSIGFKPDGTTTVYGKINYSENVKSNINLFELDGHVLDKEIFIKGNFADYEIYDKDKNQYKIRKCNKDKCSIIHLELKNIIVSGYIINKNTNLFGTAN